MRLSFYLFRENITTIEDAISKSDLREYGDPIPANPDLPFRAIAYVRTRSYQDAPDSIQFISQGFTIEESRYRRTTVNCIVFVEIEHRVFALPFGARSVLAYEHLEPGFGLRVVANSIDSKLLKSVDSLKVDNNVLQRKTQVSKNTELDDFEIDTSANWIQAVSGKTNDTNFGGVAVTLEGKPRLKTLQGRDALSFTFGNTFKKIGDQCRFLLEKFAETGYQDRFGFIDEIKFLAAKDPVVQVLDGILKAKILGDTEEKVHVVYPDIGESVHSDGFIVQCGRKKVGLEYLSLSQIKEFLHQYSIEDYESISVFAVDQNDEKVGATYALKDILIAEIDYQSATYVLLNRAWCKIDNNYVTRINTAVDEIEDFSNTLSLPPLKKQKATETDKARFEREDDYNLRIAAASSRIKFDKDNFQLGDHQKVEICDVLTKANQYLCVKKMNDSATLSHLFSQASVSSLLLRMSDKYRDTIVLKCRTKWPDFELSDSPYFVYAIPTEKEGRLSQALFFFSKVTLQIHAREIASHGHKVALCKIGIDEVERLL